MLKRVFFLLLLFPCLYGWGQTKCPENIGFDKGNFDGWQCYIGSVSRTDGSIQVSPSSPAFGRHTMLRVSSPQVYDQFGQFPVNCPNGSEYSIQLGNAQTGAQAERVSYSFTIPQNQNDYSIIYNYAVVFQNPNHADYQQPKFTAAVIDESTGQGIGCSSFSFTASGNLPGFKLSRVKDSVFYKEWTPVTIKLTGMAGRQIRLEFTTNDCSIGGHFGYAYIDVNQNCTSAVSGNIFCPSTEQLNLVAPFGFAEYKWFNSDFSKILGQQNKLTLKPVPAANTRFAVEITPFPDQGCLDTIYTTTVYSAEALDLKVTPSVSGCITNGIDLTAPGITAGSGSNLSFEYFTDASLLTHVLIPKQIDKSATYYIQGENVSGCTTVQPVSVQIQPLPVFTVTDPAAVYRPATVDLSDAVSVTNGSVYNYFFWEDSLRTNTIDFPHAIAKSGKYFITAQDQQATDCQVTSPVKVVILDPLIVAPNVFSPNGDGINDDWRIPQLSYYPECVVEVYNRSGHVVFRSDPGYPVAWDGRSQGKVMPFATYYFVIKLNDQLPRVSGSVTIVR
jgi:gliding motility-associated-like protein